MNLPRVLIVDDEPNLVTILRDAFEIAQFDVAVAMDKKGALRTVGTKAFDVALIDFRLPDGDGLDLARELRSIQDIPIVMMSGQADDIDRILGLEMVADDFLQKPFLHRELIAKVRAILRRYNTSRAAPSATSGVLVGQPVVFHGFTLELSARELTDPEGNIVELTTREFDVLAVLAANRGRVLSRQEIYLEAGIGKGQADRQVDGLISRLRAKLFSEAEATRKLRTVHGRGYVLTE